MLGGTHTYAELYALLCSEQAKTAALVAALERCVMALAANGAPNCEAAKEARAALRLEKVAWIESVRCPECGETVCVTPRGCGHQ